MMARRKAIPPTSSPDSRAASRTAIIVALIGLVGTLGAAIIGGLVSRSPAAPEAAITQPTTTSTLTATPIATFLTGADQAACLTQFMADIEPAQRVTMVMGDTQHDVYFPSQALTTAAFIGPIGLTLLAHSQAVAGVQFIFIPASQAFEITAAVDGKCQPITELSNLTRPGSNQVLQNWDALGLGLSDGQISIRFGQNGPDHFRLSARASQ